LVRFFFRLPGARVAQGARERDRWTNWPERRRVPPPPATPIRPGFPGGRLAPTLLPVAPGHGCFVASAPPPDRESAQSPGWFPTPTLRRLHANGGSRLAGCAASVLRRIPPRRPSGREST